MFASGGAMRERRRSLSGGFERTRVENRRRRWGGRGSGRRWSSRPLCCGGWRERPRWESRCEVAFGECSGGRIRRSKREDVVQWRLELGVGGRLAYARLSKLLRRPASEASGVCVIGLSCAVLTSERLLEQSDPASGAC